MKHRSIQAIIKRYDFLGRTGLYDLLVDSLLLGRDPAIRRRLINDRIIRSGARVLDAGTGTGRNLPLVASLIGAFGRIDAVDLSPGMLQHAHRRAHGLDTIRIHQRDILEHQPSEPYDVILATYVFSVHPNPAALAEHLLHLLKPTGRLIVLEAVFPQSTSLAFRSLLRFEEWIAAADLTVDFSRVFSLYDAVLFSEYDAFSYIRCLEFGRQPDSVKI